MRTRNFLRSCYHGLVGRAPAYLLGAVFTAGLAFSINTYAVHDLGVFELDNGVTGANAIDQSSITNADASSPDDWAQNALGAAAGTCPAGFNSCGYVSGPNVNPSAPGGSAFRSLFIQDPNGVEQDANGDNADTIFTGGGSKDDLDVSQWLVKRGSPPDKDDLLAVGAAAYLEDLTDDDVDNPELLIYLFGTLFAPNGDAAIGAWLFKKNIGICDDGINGPGDNDPFGVVNDAGTCLAVQPINLHSIGDVFVVAQNTNGGRNVEMELYKWVDENDAGGVDTAAATAAKADCVSDGGTLVNNNLCLVFESLDARCTGALTDDLACGTMNLGETKGKDAQPGFPTESPDDWGFQSKFPPASGPASPAGTDGIGNDDFPPTSLFEAGFDFSRLFGDEIGCFNSFLMNTRASQSVDAVLKDLAVGKFPLCGISVDKTGPEKSKVGDDVTYTYTITNTGAITLYLDTVVDDVIGDLETTAVANGCASLVAQGSCTFDVNYTVQAGDPDPLINEVVVHYNSASDLTGDDQTASDDHSVDLFQPSITLDKTGDELSKVGDDVNYVITLNNTSSNDTPDLECTISDPLIGLNKQVTLASGASDVTNAVYTVQAGDPDPLLNTASASCSPIGFSNVFPASDGHSVDLFQPSITLDKTGDDLSKVGDDVNYVITLENTSSGNSPDLECTITDAKLGINENVTLASGANHVINAVYTVQAGDPDPLLNTAEASCSPIGFSNVLPASDDHSVQLFQPSITLDKTGDELSKVGDDVNYVITLNNTSSGDSPDLACTITDATLGINENVTLASGANHVINAVYTVQAGDIDPLMNTASASCSPIGFPNVLPASDDHSVNLFEPGVSVDKSANCEVDIVLGQTITYTYLITNTGSPNSPDLVNGTIVDDVLGNLLDGANPYVTSSTCSSTLATGSNCTITADYVSPSAELVVNNVAVHYNPDGFPNDIQANDQQTCNVVLPNPAFVVIEKLLLDAQNLPFDYTATGLPVPGFQLTPLFGGTKEANSPFADPAVNQSFADTIAFTVDIPTFGATEVVTVTEDTGNLPQFVSFDDLQCAAAVGGTLTGHSEVGATATLTLGSGDFAFCRYVNSFTPGDEGCTPGYWKQPHHFDSWVPTGYTTDTLLSLVFDFSGLTDTPKPNDQTVSFFENSTMLEALSFQGGTGKMGAVEILLRAAVAAVLNASHPDVQYGHILGDVILSVNNALASNDRDTMLALATELDNANNGVTIDNGGTESCPLN